MPEKPVAYLKALIDLSHAISSHALTGVRTHISASKAKDLNIITCVAVKLVCYIDVLLTPYGSFTCLEPFDAKSKK